nr:unnamed protein product [Haemonchus contortus]
MPSSLCRLVKNLGESAKILQGISGVDEFDQYQFEAFGKVQLHTVMGTLKGAGARGVIRKYGFCAKS